MVKLINAESTWLETAWEDRKRLLKSIPEGVSFCYVFLSSPGVLIEQGSKVETMKMEEQRDDNEFTASLLSNVRFTELRSGEGKSTVRKQVGQIKGNNKSKATTDSLHRLERKMAVCHILCSIPQRRTPSILEEKSRT